MRILTIGDKKDEKFLRKKVAELKVKKEERRGISELVKKMRNIMHEAQGIGLAANQVEEAKRIFVAELPADEKGRTRFYALINPRIVKESKEKVILEEGCLSTPNLWGPVLRAKQITIEGFTPSLKKVKIGAYGLLARVFQHEMDHLDGVLFIDKAREVYEAPKNERA